MGLAPAILGAFGVTLQGQRDPRDQVLEYLRGKELLLVLDNFEQLLTPDQIENEVGAALLTDMGHHAPGVTLLVASRERLALQGEWLFDVPGLSYPPGELTEGLSGYSAVQLFVHRTSQVRRQFALDGETRAVARICRLVEGLPLAIELAAAALRTRSCTAIAEAIERGLSALASGLRSIPERHRSMWATFEHSWRLLSDEERQVFARLAVFRGGFEEEGAAAVAQASSSLLAALVDKSLLRSDGMARYDMHELVRQYASEKLEQAGEAGVTRNDHAAYFLALAETAEPALSGPQQRTWMERLEDEHDNLRAALAWSQAAADGTQLGLRLAGALGWFWASRGYVREGRDWLAQALAHPAAAAPALVRAKALLGAGHLAVALGDIAAGDALITESLALSRALDDQRGSDATLANMGGMALILGDFLRATTLFEQSLALHRDLGNRHGSAWALCWLGNAARERGDYVRATADLREALILQQQCGLKGRIGRSLERLAGLAARQQRPARAVRLFGAAATLREAIGAPLPPGERADYDRDLASAHAQLDEASFAAAWAEGAALTHEQAIAYALKVSAADAGRPARAVGT